jgi:phosphonate transport system ATP-binding protein
MADFLFLLDTACVRFREHAALDGVSLRIAAGERVGIVGPSGAGKTTLLRLLVGAVRPTSGSVQVRGRDLATLAESELRAVRGATGFIHQDHRLVPTQRVLTNVLAGRLGKWSVARALREMLWPRRCEQERVYAILERVGIPEKIFERVDSLSGGQQQRVAIGRALYQGPQVLLADEPISGVDPARARDTLGLLVGIAEEAGLTLCASVHNLELAREFFPRLVGLRGGRVVFDGSTQALSDADFAELYKLAPAELREA